MANQYVNKVVINNEAVVDLTADNITPADVLYGRTAHDASGAPIVGTAIGGTLDHSELANRDIVNQHPISAITGLSESLDEKENKAPTITIEVSQVISQDPFIIQLTDEQDDIMTDTSIPSVNFDLSQIGLGVIIMPKVDDGSGARFCGVAQVPYFRYNDSGEIISIDHIDLYTYAYSSFDKCILVRSAWSLDFDNPFTTEFDVNTLISAELSNYRTASDQNIIDASKYVKPSTGIPKSDLASSVQTSLEKADAALSNSQKGTANGVAELDSNGKVPSSQLPSYVDDVLEFASKSSFPATGETGKIYIDTSTNLSYRWGGSAYVEISPSIALGETSSTAYRGDRGKTAYDHSQETGNPHSTTLAQIPDDSTHRTVTDTEKSTWNSKGTYSKPDDGIPKTDLASDVQTSLGKADSSMPTSGGTFSGDITLASGKNIKWASITQANSDPTYFTTFYNNNAVNGLSYTSSAQAWAALLKNATGRLGALITNNRVASCDNANENGFWYIGDSDAKRPSGVGADGKTDYNVLAMIHGKNSNGSVQWGRQIATDFRTNRMWKRYCNNSVWSAWELIAGASDIAGKQETISDLATIRAGAAAGATALQSVPSTYRTAAAQDIIDAAKYVKPSSGIPASDLASGVIPTALSQLSGDSTHRTVTDSEKSAWNAKGTYSKPSGGIPASDIAAGVIPPSGTRWFDWNTVTYEQLAAEYAVNKNIGIVNHNEFAHLVYTYEGSDAEDVFSFSALYIDGKPYFHDYTVSSSSGKSSSFLSAGVRWYVMNAWGTEENDDFYVDELVEALAEHISLSEIPVIMYSNANFLGTPAIAFLFPSHVGTIEIDGVTTLGAIFSGRAIVDSTTMQTHDIVIVADLMQNEWRMLVDKNLMDERIDSKIQNAIGNAIGGSY